MVNIAVLDDEAIYIDHIKEITDTCMQQMNLEYRIRVYDEGQDVLDDLENMIINWPIKTNQDDKTIILCGGNK